MKDQVLSIEKVKQLKDLGFDVEKYSSLIWASCGSCRSCKEQDKDTLHFENKGFCGYKAIIPTLTIGDIIKILPKVINTSERVYYLVILPELTGDRVRYMNDKFDKTLYTTNAYTLIDSLFLMLVYCIENKNM